MYIKELAWDMWIGFTILRKGPMESYNGHCNESSDSIISGEFLQHLKC
jgi:hypothetical protein